jgi:hypothetical protein
MNGYWLSEEGWDDEGGHGRPEEREVGVDDGAVVAVPGGLMTS